MKARRILRPLLAGLLACCLAPVAPGQTVKPSMLLLDGDIVDNAVVAVGERGTILVSGDRGNTWRRSWTPTRATLTGVSFPDVPRPRRGWAVGHEAEILVSTDRGLTWTRQFRGGGRTDSFLDVIALDEQAAIAVGAYGLFASTRDGGTTWNLRRIREEDAHLNRISAGPTGKLYIAGEAGTLLRSSDKGSTWKEIACSYRGSFYGVLPLGPVTLLAHGLRGHVFRSEDDGENWREVSTPAPALLACSLRIPGRGLLLAGQARSLFLSPDEGRTMIPLDPAPTAGVAELIDVGEARILALGESGATILTLP